MKEDIRRIFDNTIIASVPNKEVQRFLLNHERKDRVIENLAQQIRQTELSLVYFDTRRYVAMVQDLAKFFCENAIKFKEEQLLTYNERQRRIHESDNIKRAEEIMVDLEKEAKETKSYPGKPISE